MALPGAGLRRPRKVAPSAVPAAAAMAAGPPPPLEPIPLPVYRDEGFADKFRRKTRENPLVPLGEGPEGR